MVRFPPAARAVLAALFVLGCARSPGVQVPAEPPPKVRCTYRVSAPARAPFVVSVNARCEGGKISGFRAQSPALARFVQASRAAQGGVFPAPVAELSYRVDLDAMARALDDLDSASRFGSSLVAPASSFLLQPDPEPNGAPAEVRFDGPVVTGLRRGASGYAIETHELRVATYTAFGARELRSVDAGGMRLNVALLDGPLDVSFDAVARWVERAGRAVVSFYGRPLDTDVSVILAPLPDRRGIPFGKLLPESGPGIVVLVGEHTAEPELYRDWVLVHELFHVGSPSFQGEGKWLDEGLATYFEPIIRARAGFISEAEVWAEFLGAMPRGLPALGARGLEHSESYADTYWGGGLFCLLADVEARRRSAGRHGLEDGVRAVLAAGGIASEVWPLARSLDVADRALGGPLLAVLAERHARQGNPVDLGALFRDLGVFSAPDGGVRFDETAPLAAVRRVLVGGTAAQGRPAPPAP